MAQAHVEGVDLTIRTRAEVVTGLISSDICENEIKQTFRAGLRQRPPGRLTKPGNTSAAPALMEVVSIPPAKCSSPTPPTFKARATIHTPYLHHGKASAHSLDHTLLDPAENTAII